MALSAWMRLGDPWNDVPEERRLDFEVIRKPLAALAETTLNRIEREWPAPFAGIEGARVLFQLLTYVAVTTYQTIVYFCAEKPEDHRRKIEFVDSAPPLLRSIADGVFTLAFIAESVPERVREYYRAGWREVAERDGLYRARYGGAADWNDWLAGHAELVAAMLHNHAITAAEAAKPTLVAWWPTPAQMKTRCSKRETRDFFEYLEAWIYRELSQETHLSFPGLSHRGGNSLRRKDDPLRESTWLKKRSDAAAIATILVLALLTEVNVVLRFDAEKRCPYLWGVLREYFGIAEELYAVRYQTMLAG
jgi:hypothetical protein